MDETKYRFCLIIGAGASGLLQGAELIKQGILKHHEFEIIERNSGYGGVWWQSTYPGAACDIPSNVYQISWYPNPRSMLTAEWTRRFSGSQEIAAYSDGFARRFNLPLSTSFNQNVIKTVWSDKEMLWTVITEERGTKKRTTWKANVVCHATGLFNREKVPAIPGAAKFKGQAWHTTNWPSNADLAGKRIAVIGTGPSAAQVIPSIQPIVKSMTVYQRSPSWCLPRDDYAYSPLQRFIFNWVLFTHYLYCWWLGYTTSAVAFKAFRPGSGVSEIMEAVGIKHLENQVKDPALREKLRPSGRFGYAERSKVESERKKAHSTQVVVEGLGLNNYKAISDTGERQTEVDVIIWGTGFVVQEWGTVYEIVGRGRITLGEHWGQDCHTLYGVATSNFPNFCILYGPNTSAPWVSLIYMFELQAKYNARVITELKKRNSHGHVFAIMPDPGIERVYTESLYPELAKLSTNPAFGCHAYYNNEKGINTHYYPYRSKKYKESLGNIKWENYYILEKKGKEVVVSHG